MDYKTYQRYIPADFKSDGCTLAPDGKWKQCCILHDAARRDETVTAAHADNMLYACMRDHSNLPLAILYYFAVRVQSLTGISPLGLGAILLFGISVTAGIYFSQVTQTFN